MTATKQDFTMFVGTRMTLRLTVTRKSDDSNFTLGQPLRFVIARFSSSGETPITAASAVLVEKLSANSGEIVVDPEGLGDHICDVVLNSADTDNSFVGARYFQLEHLEGTEESVLAVGTITFRPNVENA